MAFLIFLKSRGTVTGIARHASIARFAYENTEILDLHLVSDPCGAIVQLFST